MVNISNYLEAFWKLYGNAVFKSTPLFFDPTLRFGFGYAFVGNAEDLEKINPERLAPAVFIGSISPSAAEGATMAPGRDL